MAGKMRVVVVGGGAAGFFAAIACAEKLAAGGEVTIYEATAHPLAKVRVSGGDTVYAIPELPKDQPAPEDHLRRVLGEWVGEIASSGNLVVLRTPPGSAHVVGSALDRAALDGILGTVAGDDTLIVVASESTGGEALSRRLSELAGL